MKLGVRIRVNFKYRNFARKRDILGLIRGTSHLYLASPVTCVVVRELKPFGTNSPVPDFVIIYIIIESKFVGNREIKMYRIFSYKF